MKRKFLSKLMVLFLLVNLTFPSLQSFITAPFVSYAATSYDLPINTDDGLILHAFDWSFKTIENNLSQIAAAEYKSIQVSPVQGTKDPSTDPAKWWLLYQPTNQYVGNYQLGTLDDFASLCRAADAYGILIIVDVVMNHMANNGNPDQLDASVDAGFKDSSFYHNLGQCNNWNSRYDVTQRGIGMPDLNTQNIAVQNKAIAFLNQCIDAGADGFRFDAAKHIETTTGADENQSWNGNYWANVLGNLHNKSNLFIYGEILQDGTVDNIASYETLMHVSASNYGHSLRNAITSNNLSQATGMGGTNQALSVDFVETHDTYADNSSIGLTALQRKLGWAIVAARNKATPLYFVRPVGALGSAGETEWQDADVVAVNKFHNAMVGQSEYLRLTNNNQTMLIDRGTIGTTIVNFGTSNYINSPTNLANGTYVNHASQNCTLTVSNGVITGNIPANSVIVIYNASTIPTASANIKGGTYSTAQNIVLTASTSAPIYYTTDGSTPTASSMKYTAAINVANSLTLKFIAVDSSAGSSLVYTEQYIIDSSIFTPHSGYTVDYDSSKLMQGENLTVYYNGFLTNSSSVTLHWGFNNWLSPVDVKMTKRADGFWEGAVMIPTSATVLDFVFTNGSSWDNNSSKDWHLSILSVYTPTATANIKGGTYYSAQNVILTPSTSATIHYTTDGSTPTSTSSKYTAAINVARSLTLKFIAVESNAVSSPVYTEQYLISTNDVYAPHSGYKVDYDSSKLVQGENLVVYYNGSLTSSSSVSLHWGYNNWLSPTDVIMTKRSDGFWEAAVTIPTSTTLLDLAFTDGSSWDNNGGEDWHCEVRSGFAPVQVSPAPTATKPVTGYYNGTLAANATSMTLRWGYNNFTGPQDVTMTKQSDGRWAAPMTLPSGSYSLNMAFKNNNSVWDSNNSSNYNFTVSK